jgi:hypothetical protein
MKTKFCRSNRFPKNLKVFVNQISSCKASGRIIVSTSAGKYEEVLKATSVSPSACDIGVPKGRATYWTHIDNNTLQGTEMVPPVTQGEQHNYLVPELVTRTGQFKMFSVGW